MNSTITGWDPPLRPISHAAAGFVWANVVFILLSLSILIRKLIIDPGYLRLVCFIMGLAIFGMAIVNALHTIIPIPFILDVLMRLAIVAFVDLVVAVSFIISRRFYNIGQHVNRMYYIALAAVVVANLLTVANLLARLIAPADNVNLALRIATLNIVTRAALVVAVVLSYGYAFGPVLRSKVRVGVSPVVIAVGVWYMTGMGIILIIELAIGIASIALTNYVQPTSLTVISNPQSAAILNTVETILIILNLDFYSLPPSRAVISLLRRWVVPRLTTENAGTSKVEINQDSTWQIELELVDGKLPDEE